MQGPRAPKRGGRAEGQRSRGAQPDRWQLAWCGDLASAPAHPGRGRAGHRGPAGAKLHVLIEDDASHQEAGHHRLPEVHQPRPGERPTRAERLSNTRQRRPTRSRSRRRSLFLASPTQAPTGSRTSGKTSGAELADRGTGDPRRVQRRRRRSQVQSRRRAMPATTIVFTKAGYDVMQKALADLSVKVLPERRPSRNPTGIQRALCSTALSGVSRTSGRYSALA